MGELPDRHVDLANAERRANAGDRMLKMVAWALASDDRIDDADALAPGGTQGVTGCAAKAAFTSGTFLPRSPGGAGGDPCAGGRGPGRWWGIRLGRTGTALPLPVYASTNVRCFEPLIQAPEKATGSAHRPPDPEYSSGGRGEQQQGDGDEPPVTEPVRARMLYRAARIQRQRGRLRCAKGLRRTHEKRQPAGSDEASNGCAR